MSAAELLNTIYLGDRACKAIVLDGWNNQIKILVDCISRVRGTDGWNYYTDEDIYDGYIVFDEVYQFDCENFGRIPNDSINDISIELDTDEGVSINISIDSVSLNLNPLETFLKIKCKSVHLEDPKRPNEIIIE